MAYFPLSEWRILGHWKVSLVVPIIVALLLIVCHLLFIYDTYDKFPSFQMLIIAFSVTSFAFLCMAMAYIMIIVAGPGYVPFDWCRTGRRRAFSWEYAMGRIVQFKDQVEWAKVSADRPPRSAFGQTALRFVLRADHYCTWAKSWIGLNNHRYFMLTCMWTFIYAMSNLGFRYWFYLSLANASFNYFAIPGLVTLVFILFLAGFSLYHFVVSMNRLRKNVTSLEVWGNRASDEYNRGCYRNFEEVCGHRKYAICWPFPFITCLRPMSDGFYNEANVFESEISTQTISEVWGK